MPHEPPGIPLLSLVLSGALPLGPGVQERPARARDGDGPADPPSCRPDRAG